MEILVRDQEVRNPLAKGMITVGFFTVIIPLVTTTLPVSILSDFALKAIGRKGFFREKSIIFDFSSFRKA